MNIERLRRIAKPADTILISGSGTLSYLIKYGQKPLTIDGLPSKWSHVLKYVDKDTIWDSTIDFKPYKKTGKRFDNGIQYNDILNLEHVETAQLIQNPWTDGQREMLLDEMDRLEKLGITYPVAGLVGSLLSYWIFGWSSNPLQGKGSLYCSAAIQEVDKLVDIDYSGTHTARNTAPEHVSQYYTEGQIRYNF